MNLKYGYGEESFSIESLVYQSDNNFRYDYLVVIDSRGLVNNLNLFEYSYILLLKKEFDKLNFKYLIISRPKNLTVFATVYNFLKLKQNLKFKILITNLGFVDCTPKKKDNINDILEQIKQFSNEENEIIGYDNYQLSNGNQELLESIKYSKKYLQELTQYFNENFEKCYFINTPIVSENFSMERQRPKSFFKQLYETNDLINNIVSLNDANILVDIKDLNYTYDGVHYTKEGHSIIFDKIKESIML